MATYAVTTVTTDPGTAAEVAAILEAIIETVESTKNIHVYQLNPTSRDRDQCVGVLVYDT